eukprot:TRINITY_DN74348_c0_g1_i1.p1 TRINITY_DN74348_c0_g1~~TRINITY_DN74348_c0_g1_i1.p1  ORF type:complete len:668 (-),score=94.56 TRINITY_DN74348_c0_g1_i1:41-2044(-)
MEMSPTVVLSSSIAVVVIALSNYALRTFQTCWFDGIGIQDFVKDLLSFGPKSSFEALVEEKMEDMRRRQWLNLIKTCEPLVAFLSICGLVKCLFASESIFTEDAAYYIPTFFRQAVVLAIFEIFPSIDERLANRAMIALSWFFLSCQVAAIIGLLDQHSLLLHRPMIVCMRCLIAVFLSGVKNAVAQQVIILFAQAYCYGAPVANSVSELVGMFSWQQFMKQEVPICLCIIVTTVAAQRTMEAEARATLSGTQASEGKATADALLSVMCDAVVHVDSDFRISEPAPKLAALLLNPSVKLEGRPMLDMMTCEDAGRFRSACQAAQSDKHARTLNANFCTGVSSSPVNLRVYIAYYRNFDDKPGYVIGFEDHDGCERDIVHDTLPFGIEAAIDLSAAVGLRKRAKASNLSECDTHAESLSACEEACQSEASTDFLPDFNCQVSSAKKQEADVEQRGYATRDCGAPSATRENICESSSEQAFECEAGTLSEQDACEIESDLAAVSEAQPHSGSCDSAPDVWDVPFWRMSISDIESLDRNRACFHSAMDLLLCEESSDECSTSLQGLDDTMSDSPSDSSKQEIDSPFRIGDACDRSAGTIRQALIATIVPETTAQAAGELRNDGQSNHTPSTRESLPSVDVWNVPFWELPSDLLEELDRGRERFFWDSETW